MGYPRETGEPDSWPDCGRRGMARGALEGTGTTERAALPISPQHKSRTTPRAQTAPFSSRKCLGPTVKVCWRMKTPGKL